MNTKTRLRSSFSVTFLNPHAVFVVDNCRPEDMSVTNDAENVVRYLHEAYGDRKFYYRDTLGYWCELEHNNGVFTRFSSSAFNPDVV